MIQWSDRKAARAPSPARVYKRDTPCSKGNQ